MSKIALSPMRRFVALVVGLAISLGLAPGWSRVAFAASEYITLSSFSGHPGEELQVRGGGFNPGETVHVMVDNSNFTGTPYEADAVVAFDGEFSPVTIMVPVRAPQGPLAIKGTGLQSGKVASNSYYVQPFTPNISMTSTANTPGSTLMVSGTGFAHNESVMLKLESTVTNVTAQTDGSFTEAQVAIPQVLPGVYVLHAQGVDSGAEALGYFYIGGFYPSAQPSSYYLVPEQMLSFSASGFAPNESVQITEGESATVLATTTTNGSGSFMDGGSIKIPLSFANSSRTFHLMGLASGAKADLSVKIGQFYPVIWPSAYYALPGEMMSFSGNNFAPQEEVKVYVGTGTTAVATLMTMADGSFENAGSFQIPYTYAGTSKSFRLVGSRSGVSAEVAVSIGRLYPQVSPSSWYIKPGDSLTFGGYGFAGSEMIKLFRGMETAPLASFAADTFGAFSGAGASAIPYSMSGQQIHFALTGDTSNATGDATITVGQLYPQFNPSSYYLKPAQKFAVSGVDFAPNEDIEVWVGDILAATAKADALGGFMVENLTMPFTAQPTLEMTAKGLMSGTQVSRTVTVGSYYPYGESDRYYVTPGSTVMITGHAFAPGESVLMKSGANTISATADEMGDTPTTAITIPFGVTGSADITLTGAASKAQATVTISLAPFMPSVTPSTYYAQPGTQVTFTGTGFVGGESVTVKEGTTTIATVVADSNGAITAGPTALPFGDMATYTFRGSLSNAPVDVQIGLAQFYSGITLDTYYGVGGTPIHIAGSGFASGEPVSVKFGGVLVGSVPAASDGTFALDTKVPYATPGDKQVMAVGAGSHAKAATTFTQAPVYVSVQLGTYAGAPGTAVQIIGSGFLANEPVDVTTDRNGTTVVHTFTAGADGTFTNSGYSIPADFAEGNLTLTIGGQWSLNPQSIVFYVTGS
jgi:hypothetical protein